MLRPGSFFSRSASFAVVGTGFLAPRQLNLDRAGRRGPFGAVGVAGLLRHQFGGDAEPHAGAGIGDDLPADAFLLSLGGVGEDAALLRIEHAGLLAAACLLEFLDRVDHALADVAGDGAVILADPGEVRLQRQPLGLRHRIRRLLRLLQRGADRYRRDRFRLGARRGGRRHLRLRGARGRKTEAAIINVAESTDLMTNPGECRSGIVERSLTSRQLSTSAWSAPTAPRFRD